MKALYKPTPLLLSHRLSEIAGRNIYLKMESLQPSGSFKDRGIGALCEYYANEKVKGFISSSGGNAGLAVAYASKMLGIPCQVIIPQTTPTMMINKIRAEDADVIIFGNDWNQADERARELSEELHYAYIPPFDHPVIWQGYTSLIKEMHKEQIKPNAIIVSVGGGGLFSGLIKGLYEVGWNESVTMITAETEGAATLAKSVEANERIILDKINTIAVTLGAKQICQQAFDWTQKHPVLPQVVTDKEAVDACLKFADDHRLLVEPACGAALAIIYQKRQIIEQFQHIVVVVCGGNGVSLQLLQNWKSQFEIS